MKRSRVRSARRHSLARSTSHALLSCGCIFVILTLIALCGCGSAGSEYLGKWVNVKNSHDTMEVSRNGDQFLITNGSQKIGAVYKEGSLEVSGFMGSIRITYVKNSGTLVVGGDSEYKKL